MGLILTFIRQLKDIGPRFKNFHVNNLFNIFSVYDKYCFCPIDCESTQYVFETSTAWRTPRDTSYLIKSYSKKNKLLDNVKKEIKELDGMCISPEEKEIRLKELKQLNKSIAYTSTMIQFFWKEDTMVSYVRDQHYTIVDMLGIIIAYQYNLKCLSIS